VILPQRNLADLEEIPGEISRKIDFIGVSHMDEVLKAALVRMPSRRKAKVPSAPAASPRAGVAAAKSND
jgi:ATP-dependent Lon protease